MLVPIKDPKRGWLLEHRPATRRASARPGPSGKRRRIHGLRTYDRRTAEHFAPLLSFHPFAKAAGILAAVAGFLNIGRRKAA